MLTFKKSSLGREIIRSGVCALAIWSLAACGQNTARALPDASVPEASVSPKFTAEGLAALDTRLKAAVDQGEVYGLSYVLGTSEGEVQRGYHGVQSLTTGVPVQENTIFRIYSMSKPITSIAMMMLWEEGAWQLDDPVIKYVPEFEGLRVLDGMNADGTPKLTDAARPPNMREVMSHMAGFAYGLGGRDYANQQFRDQKILSAPDMESFIARVADVPLLYQPGTDWAYSASVDIQGYIIEKLSGQKFSQFLKDRIFTPLSMTDTGFYVPEGDVSRLSDVFGWYEKAGRLVPAPGPEFAFTKDTVPFESGGGGMVSTLDDYAHFSQMLLNGGTYNGTQFVKPETLQMMTTNLVPEGVEMWSAGNRGRIASTGQGFGLGFGIVTDPEDAATRQGEGSFYWGGAAGTWFWIDPKNDVYFIGMIQRFSGNPVTAYDPRTESRKAVYNALTE